MKASVWLTLCILLLPISAALGKDAQLPPWVESPPADNLAAIYGIGAGTDVETAKKQALADIAGKLSTRVASEVQIYQQVVDGEVGEQFRSTVVSSVDETELNHYRIEKSTVIEPQTWVLLALDLDKFNALKQQQLNAADQQLQDTMQRFTSANDLQRFIDIPEAETDLDSALTLIATLRATGSFNSSEYDVRYNRYHDSIARTLDRLIFAVEADENGQELAADLVELLSDAGLNAQPGSNGAARVRITTSIQSSEEKSATSVRMNTSLVTTDADGLIVGSRQYYSKGRSYDGYTAALRLASRSVARRMKSNGVAAGLGLQTKQVD